MSPIDTDADWESWGRRDPYFGVITDGRYRRVNLTQALKTEFFQSGEGHVQHLLQVCRGHIDKDFAPQSALDFGCGVGRVAIPLARIVDRVVGVDVSDSMLDEARKNCDFYQVNNVELVKSDDTLSAVSGRFALVHSSIVFQHIEPARGRDLFKKLVSLLAPGGICAAHFTYAKSRYPSTYGAAPAPEVENASRGSVDNSKDSDPLMLMTAYNVNELLFIAQTSGVERIHLEFTDHGGDLGAVLYFRK